MISSASILQVGQQAPDFSLPDENGNLVSLGDFAGKNVAIFFYPKDLTPGCTREGCRFRDLKAEFDAKNCVILGVSADDEESHQRFIAEHSFNFHLLADTSRQMVGAYGAESDPPGVKVMRSSVLIGGDGLVRAVWNPVKNAGEHPDEVLAALA
uniref:thioredoxin-dependent peroxiredoxin n=1 Tax=Fibrocapsa japonica TaxID=94617 RepID=A0A7S2V4W9_9STRA|mmetsp:Transcript_456/g.672  ORF Transcript_456/g.672 Transcript_456/m.672 type:complete len:154 (+) Transcript_456:103-564(+)|eukprot:CAMPEP_0113944550 /NCGR_PEP_ID=MMETSP1339-20121228/34492_1 /TAXON_ID=94617 /ORGANISM="Fibrocapsa japonica" /LENGTH=153 /DNA_ID=CAMNT_0000949785 /DNA_START=103 /DNA_END=564 /DNA_ORIENTATION=- /assembly_acc=CAM_ASM_000762